MYGAGHKLKEKEKPMIYTMINILLQPQINCGCHSIRSMFRVNV